jgi:hypothetical protein
MEMGKFVPQIFRHFEVRWASEQPEWRTHAAWFWKQSHLLVTLRDRNPQGNQPRKLERVTEDHAM